MDFDVNFSIVGVSGEVEAREAAEVEVWRWRTRPQGGAAVAP